MWVFIFRIFSNWRNHSFFVVYGSCYLFLPAVPATFAVNILIPEYGTLQIKYIWSESFCKDKPRTIYFEKIKCIFEKTSQHENKVKFWTKSAEVLMKLYDVQHFISKKKLKVREQLGWIFPRKMLVRQSQKHDIPWLISIFCSNYRWT